jgi:hypothetical protein
MHISVDWVPLVLRHTHMFIARVGKQEPASDNLGHGVPTIDVDYSSQVSTTRPSARASAMTG